MKCTYLHLQSPIIVLRFAAFDKRAKAPDSRDTQSRRSPRGATSKTKMQDDRKKGKNQTRALLLMLISSTDFKRLGHDDKGRKRREASHQVSKGNRDKIISAKRFLCLILSMSSKVETCSHY